MRRVLFVAAEPFELKWIQPRKEFRVIKVSGGAGPRCAAAVLNAADEYPDAVVSTGLCGGLDPILRIGEIFVASEVNREAADSPRTNERHSSGSLLSTDRIVGTAAEKHELFMAGYRAVEMEAAAALRYARFRGLPFYCVRAVSDVSDENFELDLNAARDSSGRIRAGSVLLQAIRRPIAIGPELMRLRRNADQAARALGAFIGKCDF